MALYKVKVRDVRTVMVEIVADTAESAMLKAKNGLGRGMDLIRTETYAEVIEVIENYRPDERELS